MTDKLDPITLEIVANGLLSVADESFAALMKSAYSTNIKERRDHSTAIVDPAGRLIVQAAGSLPIHIASMMGLMKHLFEKYGDDIHEDDIFIANDPHVAGGTHLPDINMAMPIFHDGRLIGFMCNIAHHADMGGMVPGSMAGGMSEIYQEGLRVPVVRLFSKGELQRDLLDLLLLNVRVMEERRGDYYAQIAACRLGTRRVLELADQYGADLLLGVFDDIVARTAKRMRTAIKSLPDGVYAFEDVMDDDGLGTVDIPIKLKVTIKGSRVRFDFTGTSPQVRGNINVTWNATQAAVCYAIKALLDPDGAEQSRGDRPAGHRRARGYAVERGVPGAGRGTRQYQPAHHRRRHRRSGEGLPRYGGCGRQRRQHHGGVLGRRSEDGQTICLSRDSRRRLRRSRGQGRQGRGAGSHHKHVQPAGRGDRNRVSASGGVLRVGGGLRRGGQIPRWARAAPGDRSGRPHHLLQWRGANGSATRPGGSSAARPAGAGASCIWGGTPSRCGWRTSLLI